MSRLHKGESSSPSAKEAYSYEVDITDAGQSLWPDPLPGDRKAYGVKSLLFVNRGTDEVYISNVTPVAGTQARLNSGESYVSTLDPNLGDPPLAVCAAAETATVEVFVTCDVLQDVS